MTKYIIGLFVLIIGAIALLYFKIGVLPVYQEETSRVLKPHLSTDIDKSIERISITAFYFIPRDKTHSKLNGWRQTLTRNLEKLKEFHALQLQEYSEITYEIYPSPIEGIHTSLYYDSETTQFGNPHALRQVALEIEQRVFNKDGNLYFTGFGQSDEQAYQVWYIMYEGVGSSGSENVALISSTFLSDPQYKVYGITYFVHEFYHTLGLADGYETPSDIPFTDDIMGSGRTKSINQTFLSRENLNHLGL